MSSSAARKLRAPPLAENHHPRPLAFRRLFGRRLTVNVLTDPGPFKLGADGVLDAFQECLGRLGEHPDLELRVDDSRPADLLHHLGFGPAFFYRGTRAGGRRLCTVQLPAESSGLSELARPIVRGFLRAVCDRADAVIATTPDSARQLRALGTAAAIRTMPGTVSARFTPSAELRQLGRSRLGLGDDRPVVLGMGGLRREDGIADFAATARSLPEALFLWVDQDAGRGPSDAVGVDAFVADGPSNLRFAGALPETDLPAVFNAADLLLHTALHADRPRTPLSAAACGLPLVLRELPEYRSLLRGECLSAFESVGYVAAVRRLLASATERARWAALSRRLAEPYRLAPVTDAVASLYDLAACGKLAPREPELASTSSGILEWPL
jgi:1,2-diacylglycerol-3-alpha-glucose alpha-1,2-galactosyltransferase